MRTLRRRTAFGLSACCGATALALGAAVMSTPGCAERSSDDEPASGTAFEAGAPASAASAACTACAAEECTGAWALCLTDARCRALRACNNPFSESQDARERCFCETAQDDADAPSGAASDAAVDPLALYAAYASCNDARTCTTCASDCVASCANGQTRTTAGACAGGDAGDAATAPDASADADAGDAGGADAASDASAAPAPVTADTCSACVASKCNDAKRACALGTECSLFLACTNGCADAACADACERSFATGRSSATELSSCTLTGCRSACGL